MSEKPQRRTYVSRIVLPQRTGRSTVTVRRAEEQAQSAPEPATRRPSFRERLVEKDKGKESPE